MSDTLQIKGEKLYLGKYPSETEVIEEEAKSLSVSKREIETNSGIGSAIAETRTQDFDWYYSVLNQEDYHWQTTDVYDERSISEAIR